MSDRQCLDRRYPMLEPVMLLLLLTSSKMRLRFLKSCRSGLLVSRRQFLKYWGQFRLGFWPWPCESAVKARVKKAVSNDFMMRSFQRLELEWWKSIETWFISLSRFWSNCYFRSNV